MPRKKGVHELSPLVIREEAETYAKSEVQNQLQQFRQLGIMADWTPHSTYRTLGQAPRHPVFQPIQLMCGWCRSRL